MKTIVLKNINLNKIQRKSMWKPSSPSSLGNKLFRLQQPKIQKAEMGRYSVVNYKKDEVVKPDGSPLDQHEVTHYSIFDKETGEVIGLLTSSKKDSFKLSTEKMDGTIIETKDAEWNIVPDPEKGGQYITFYGTVRVVNKDIVKEYPPGSLYLEEHERKIAYMQEKANLANYPRQLRMSKTEHEQLQKLKLEKENNKNDN